MLINAGQANAATGDAGYQDCLESAAAVSDALGIAPDEVLLLSTGVIGRRIKLDALKASVPSLASSLGASAEDAHHAAVAITTTDLVSKSAALEVGRRAPLTAPFGVHACGAVSAALLRHHANRDLTAPAAAATVRRLRSGAPGCAWAALQRAAA